MPANSQREEIMISSNITIIGAVSLFLASSGIAAAQDKSGGPSLQERAQIGGGSHLAAVLPGHGCPGVLQETVK